MNQRNLTGLAALLAAVVALTGGALAGPTLMATPAEGPVDAPVVLTGTGFAPNAQVHLEWQTMVGNRVSGSGFAEVTRPFANVTTDGAGGLRYAFNVPSDLGGPPHAITAFVGEASVASATFTILRTAAIEPSSGPAGTMIMLDMRGGGWTQYDNIVAVTYDNAYIGYMCSFNTQGAMTTWFPASGGVGLHSIDVWPALYTGPSDGAMPWKLPHLSVGDQPWQPPSFHFEFTVTDENGTVPAAVAQPPVGTAGDDLALGLLGASVAMFAAAAAFELPIHRALRRGRAPTAAIAAAVVLLLMVGAAAGPAQAAAPSPSSGPPIQWMAASGPSLALSKGTATPGDALTVTGSGLPASTSLELRWGTAKVVTKAKGETFLGWNVTQDHWSLGAVQTDASGAFSKAMTVPFDYGGIHQIEALAGTVPLAQSGIIIEPRFEIVGATHLKAGQKVAVAGYGLGYEKYSASWNVVYDNRLTGWVSGMEAHGNVTFSLYAVGQPGQHFIDIGEGAVGYPYLNLWESPFQNRPPGHLSFVIDGAAAPVVVAPQGSSGAGGTLSTLAPVVVAAAACGALGLQIGRWQLARKAGAAGGRPRA